MFDMSPEHFRRLGYRAVDLLADHFQSLADSPCRRPVPDALRRELMDQPIPDRPGDADELIEYIGNTILQYPMGNGSPRFFGWVNSSVAPLATLAELLADGRKPSVAGGDHSATYIGHAVLKWMKHMLGFPAAGGAILTSGGSVANLIGLAVMRHVKTAGDVRARGLTAPAKWPIVY